MRNRSKMSLRKKRTAIMGIVLTVAAVFSFFLIESRIKKYSEEIGTYYCQSQISRSVNEAVRNVLESTGADYSDFSADIYDENGKFVSSEICTKNVNIIQSMIATKITENISGLSESDIKISTGTLSGFYILNGKGPKVRFRLIPVGGVQTNLNSSFESAGINQVCHKISLDITAEVKTIFPSGSETVSVSTNCLLAECVIAGDVPDGYIIKQ